MVWLVYRKEEPHFLVPWFHPFPHGYLTLLKHTSKKNRSLWQSVTKASVLNVLPGPGHLCANDPVVLPVSVRPVSTCGLRAVCTNLSGCRGHFCTVCFSFKASKRNVLVLMVKALLFFGALPCSLHVWQVHGEQAVFHGGTEWTSRHLLV